MSGWHVSGVEGNDRRGEHYAKCETRPPFSFRPPLGSFTSCSPLLTLSLFAHLSYFGSIRYPTATTVIKARFIYGPIEHLSLFLSHLIFLTFQPSLRAPLTFTTLPLIVFNKEARDALRRNNFLQVVSPRSRLESMARQWR